MTRSHSVLALLLLAACWSESGDVSVVGSLERTQIELVAPVSEVIVEVGAERGDRVEPGRVVVRLDGTLAAAEVARAEANLAGARTADRVAESELERIGKLREGGVASQQQLEQIQLEREEATARLREAQAQVVVAYKRSGDLGLSSPVAGVVDQLPFDEGERVPAGAVLAVVLADGDPWVRVWVPEHAVARIRPGTEAEVHVDGIDRPLRGAVLDVSREPAFTPHYALTERDRAHLVYETRVRLTDAPPGLRPGVPADVRFPVGVPGATP